MCNYFSLYLTLFILFLKIFFKDKVIFLLYENESIVPGTQKVEQATQTCLHTCSTCTEIILVGDEVGKYISTICSMELK